MNLDDRAIDIADEISRREGFSSEISVFVKTIDREQKRIEQSIKVSERTAKIDEDPISVNLHLF